MSFRPRGLAQWLPAIGLAALVAACSDTAPTATSADNVAQLVPTAKPSNVALPFGCLPAAGSCVGIAGDPITNITAAVERVQVCKLYPNGTGPAVTIKVDAISPDNKNPNSADGTWHFTFPLQPNTCVYIWSNGEIKGKDAQQHYILRAADQVTITELTPAGYVTQSTQVTKIIATDTTILGHKTFSTTSASSSSQSVTDIVGGYQIPGFTVVYTNVPIYSIDGMVWEDLDANGAKNGGEGALPNVTVTLKQGNTVLGTTTSAAATGAYSFSSLVAGTYTVCTSNYPAGYTETYDVTPPTNDDCATVTIGPDAHNVDFGYTPPHYSIGDRVWNDVNGDGVQDAGESGINGVTVTLTNLATSATTSTTTSGDGGYSFGNLLAGNYTVCVSNVPAGYTATYDLDGVGTPSCTNVTLTQTRTDVDFGYTPPRYSIGDRVWNDVNGNGVQEGGEVGINGVTVTITDLATSATSSTTTAGDGNYSFGNLLAGNYTVCVSNVPAGYTATYDLDGVATPGCTNVTVSGNRTDVDFGYTPPRFSIGDRVWDDANGDGVQDGGEAGLNGATVTLYDASNNQLASTTTSGNGNYSFGNLLAGTYKVCVSGTPSGYNPTYDLDGTATANCATVTVTASRTDVDFGYQKPAPPATGSIGDFAWIDANGNGRQDAGEPGLAGVTLTLGGAGSGTQTTTGSGAYGFGSLVAGTYTVTATAPNGWVATSIGAAGTTTANDNNASPSTVILASGATNNTIDFGYVPAAGSGQGCTPGYWKQTQHFDSWKWYARTDLVDAVFNVTYRSTLKNNPSGPLTLLDALELNGNSGSEALFRHGTAALLNSVYQSNVSFPYTAPQIIQMVHDAWVSGDVNKIEATHQLLANANQLGCPLN